MIFCPSCQEQSPVGATECGVCGWSFKTTTSTPGSLIRPAAPPKQQADVELAATIDRTGSSQRFAIGIPKTFAEILKLVENKVRSTTVWLQSHGDESEGQFPVLHTDAGTAAQATADLADIRFGGGGDPDEDHLKAIEHLANVTPFSGESTKRGVILALINADTKPLDGGRTPADLGHDLADRGLLVYVVGTPTPSIIQFVKAADGLFFEISNNPDEAELKQIANQVGASVVATVASGGTRPVGV